jgi:hypothetical protein
MMQEQGQAFYRSGSYLGIRQAPLATNWSTRRTNRRG